MMKISLLILLLTTLSFLGYGQEKQHEKASYILMVDTIARNNLFECCNSIKQYMAPSKRNEQEKIGQIEAFIRRKVEPDNKNRPLYRYLQQRAFVAPQETDLSNATVSLLMKVYEVSDPTISTKIDDDAFTLTVKATLLREDPSSTDKQQPFDLLQKAIALDKAYAPAYLTKAIFLVQDKQYQAAIDLLNSASFLSNHAATNTLKAEIYAQLGNKKQSQRYYKKAEIITDRPTS